MASIIVDTTNSDIAYICHLDYFKNCITGSLVYNELINKIESGRYPNLKLVKSTNPTSYTKIMNLYNIRRVQTTTFNNYHGRYGCDFVPVSHEELADLI